MSRQVLLKRLRDRFGDSIDIARNPGAIDEIVAWSKAPNGGAGDEPAGPFGVPWMDSLVAHWVFAKERESLVKRDALDTLLDRLVEARFRERLVEINDIIRRAEPPDGGPREPGVPPVGPAVFTPPDGGPPEPGVPPVGPAVFAPPDGGPPEPGVPPVGPAVFAPPDGDPPEPGTPPAGPVGGFAEPVDNPWILYWFLSIKVPLLLDVVDVHIDRRLQELSQRTRRG